MFPEGIHVPIIINACMHACPIVTAIFHSLGYCTLFCFTIC